MRYSKKQVLNTQPVLVAIEMRRTRRRQNEGRRKRGMQLPRQRNLNLNAELMWRQALIMY
jgi:hypothetical protein